MNFLHYIPLLAIGFMIGALTDLKPWQYILFVVLLVSYRYLP